MPNRRGPQWRQVTPDDFCWNCRRIGASRMMFIRGDQEWIEMALSLMLDHDDEVIEGIAQTAMELPQSPPGYVRMPVQLCRKCADQARERFSHKGVEPLPGIYNSGRWERGEYEGTKLIGYDGPLPKDHVPQELVERELAKLIEERLHDPELHAMFAEKGVTLCRVWDEDEQDWSYYVTDNPELIAEDAILPHTDTQEKGN